MKQIRIISCKNPLLWYNCWIGETFTVHKEDFDVYWTRERDFYKSLNVILKEDCIEVE